jgi:hypothetical protein
MVRRSLFVPALLSVSFGIARAALAQPTFTNVADDPAYGVEYLRVPSLSELLRIEDLRRDSLVDPLTFDAFVTAPHRPGGLPGVVMLDIEQDGDIDVFVSNGPGADNSLLVNQLVETGSLSFSDEGAARGVGLPALDNQGACSGDLDNDGDTDLYVLARNAASTLLENDGFGNFTEVASSGAEGGTLNHVSCSMGDIDNDGLLDIAVANTFDFQTFVPIMVEPFMLNQPNQLFHNDGGLSFTDVSASSGFTVLDDVPPGAATISWAITVVDVDRDGDQDIVHADDQAAWPRTVAGGTDRGYIQVHLNDGTGNFTAQAVHEHTWSAAQWMSLSWGDFTCDGTLDVYATNFGDYGSPSLGFPYTYGDEASRLLQGDGDGTFTDLAPPYSTPFGWGSGAADMDNDGDIDAVAFGSMDLNFTILTDNPGILLLNDECSGDLEQIIGAFDADYQSRVVQGIAVADLDQDGAMDVVTAADSLIPPWAPVLPSPAQYGSALDAWATYVPIFLPQPDGTYVWSGAYPTPGTLTVELNDGVSGGYVDLDLVGSVGLTVAAGTNRSGIGALVEFTPNGSPDTAALPRLGGDGFASQQSPVLHFGLDTATHGDAEIFWPSGFRNCVRNVPSGFRVTIPEIPCSYDEPAFTNVSSFMACVNPALDDLVAAGVITTMERFYLRRSQRGAYNDGACVD